MNLDESKGQKAEGRGQKKNKLRFILPSALIPLPLFAILLSCGCTQMDHFGTVVRREYNIITGKSPLNAARQMEDQYFPDERRVGIDRLSDEDFGRRPPYTKRYEQIAQYDSDWLVRATAIRALNRSRDVDATPIFIKALSDDNDLVRTEAAKALSNIPDDNAVPSLLKLVGDPNENRDVRIWSAAALRHYKTLEVARTLAGQLGGREFGVAWQSHKSLTDITGKDLDYDEGAWLDYLTGPQKPFG